MCMVDGCFRQPTKGSKMCGPCWSLVPTETKLALEGHRDAMRHWWQWARNLGHAETDPQHVQKWLAFVRWSYDETMAVAAEEAFQARRERNLARWAAMEILASD